VDPSTHVSDGDPDPPGKWAIFGVVRRATHCKIPSHCCSVRSKKSIRTSTRLLHPTALLTTDRCQFSPAMELVKLNLWKEQHSNSLNLPICGHNSHLKQWNSSLGEFPWLENPALSCSLSILPQTHTVFNLDTNLHKPIRTTRQMRHTMLQALPLAWIAYTATASLLPTASNEMLLLPLLLQAITPLCSGMACTSPSVRLSAPLSHTLALQSHNSQTVRLLYIDFLFYYYCY